MNVLLVVVSVVCIVVSLVVIWRVVFSKMLQDTAEEYFEKFIEPQWERAQEKGIDRDRFEIMVADSLKEAEFPSRFPSGILRDKIETWESHPY